MLVSHCQLNNAIIVRCFGTGNVHTVGYKAPPIRIEIVGIPPRPANPAPVSQSNRLHRWTCPFQKHRPCFIAHRGQPCSNDPHYNVFQFVTINLWSTEQGINTLQMPETTHEMALTIHVTHGKRQTYSKVHLHA
jgi:hypothetical protein